MPLSNKRPKRQEAASTQCVGLTLLELLVVLAIVAVMAGLALRSVSGIFDQSRYESNIRQLEEIDEAILGEAGFLHDIGRLPVAAGADPRDQLRELWEAGTLPSFGIAAAPGDDEVRMGAGWRGPYLRLGLGREDLRDAFGRDLEWFEADGAVLGAGNTVGIFRSLGADGTEGGVDYDADLAVVIEAQGPAVTAGLAGQEKNRWQADLPVNILFRDTHGDLVPPDVSNGDRVLIRVYGPVEGAVATVASATLTVDGSVPATTFADLPHGPKVIRAYQANAGDLPAEDNDPFNTPPDWRTPPTNLLIHKRLSATPFELILREF